MTRWLLLSMATLVLIGCGGGDGSGSSTSIPSIQLECSSSQVAGCSANGRTAYVGLVESLTLTCDSTLKGLSANQRQSLFAVTGSDVSSSSGSILTATVSHWINNTGGAQDVLNAGAYIVCAFVDSNSNGQLDTNEPVASGVATTGEGTVTLSTWAAAH